MQLDFKYELKDLIARCKNRDLIIISKVLLNLIYRNSGNTSLSKTDNVAKDNSHALNFRTSKKYINYYSDGLRYYSFGFLKKVKYADKILAYYVCNITDMSHMFDNKVAMSKIITYWDVCNVADITDMFRYNRNRINISYRRHCRSR